MPSARLMSVLTAILLVGGTPAARSQASLDELLLIEQLLLSGDCGALHGYLRGNPRVLAGNDVLASELRTFVSGVDNGLIECLSVQRNGAGTDLGDSLGRGY